MIPTCYAAWAKQACPFKIVSLPCPLPPGDPCPLARLPAYPPNSWNQESCVPLSPGVLPVSCCQVMPTLAPWTDHPNQTVLLILGQVRHLRGVQVLLSSSHQSFPLLGHPFPELWLLLFQDDELLKSLFPVHLVLSLNCLFTLLSSTGTPGAPFPRACRDRGWR